MNTYLLDANIFIDAKNKFYGMDFCPGFWNWLIAREKHGLVISIRAVYDELAHTPDADEEEEDELSKWVKGSGKALFRPHDQEAVNQLQTVTTWATTCSRKYEQVALSTFFGCADLHIVAYALAHQCTVVTHEVASESVKKLKVPDACKGLGIKCIQSHEMLRAEGVKFVMQLTELDREDMPK